MIWLAVAAGVAFVAAVGLAVVAYGGFERERTEGPQR